MCIIFSISVTQHHYEVLTQQHNNNILKFYLKVVYITITTNSFILQNDHGHKLKILKNMKTVIFNQIPTGI